MLEITHKSPTTGHGFILRWEPDRFGDALDWICDWQAAGLMTEFEGLMAANKVIEANTRYRREHYSDDWKL